MDPILFPFRCQGFPPAMGPFRRSVEVEAQVEQPPVAAHQHREGHRLLPLQVNLLQPEHNLHEAAAHPVAAVNADMCNPHPGNS